MKLIFIEEFGKALVPEKIRPKLRTHFSKVGIKEVPYKLFGILFYVSLLITVLAYLLYLYPLLVSKNYGVVQFFLITFVLVALFLFGIAIIIMLIIYTTLDLMIYNRTKTIENVLEDFLNLVSENLKGGMSLDRALWQAIKPEFGILSKEIQITSKRVATGVPVETALEEFSRKYDSPMVRRSFGLVLEGVKSGSELSSIIDKVVDNIRETKLLKKDMVATNTTYVIFIAMIVLVIAPALFALSHQLLIILTSFSSNMGPAFETSNAQFPLKIQEIAIELDDFVLFSRLAISTVALFSSMIIALITRGTIKSGLKYIPLFLILSLLSHHFFLNTLSGVFGSIAF
jgi:pilus assembly protein TadC